MISKELFVDCIRDLQEAECYQNELNSFYRNHGVDGYIFQPDCSVTVIKILHELFEKNLGSQEFFDSDLISYFCFDLNFGKKYKPGILRDKHGRNIDLSSSAKLYDYLIKIKEENRIELEKQFDKQPEEQSEDNSSNE